MPGVGLNRPTPLSDPEGFIALRCIIVIDVFLLSLIAFVHNSDPEAYTKDSIMPSECYLRKYRSKLYFRKTSMLKSIAVALP